MAFGAESIYQPTIDAYMKTILAEGHPGPDLSTRSHPENYFGHNIYKAAELSGDYYGQAVREYLAPLAERGFRVEQVNRMAGDASRRSAIYQATARMLCGRHDPAMYEQGWREQRKALSQRAIQLAAGLSLTAMTRTTETVLSASAAMLILTHENADITNLVAPGPLVSKTVTDFNDRLSNFIVVTGGAHVRTRNVMVNYSSARNRMQTPPEYRYLDISRLLGLPKRRLAPTVLALANSALGQTADPEIIRKIPAYQRAVRGALNIS